ncbi:MAG: tripartite tricarboxylate transporter substrate binding protein [Betaproteobacteria bacterium]|nr:tripartite tricarboxylate transporter substrate binding protein [Betaproteobacteria bacterium]
MTSRRLFACLVAASAALLALEAAAQPFPTRPVEIVNAFAAGGANDLNVRALQVAAERILGQPLVQTFRQGGGGIVGTAEVAGAAPDGYKLLVVTSGELTAAPNLAKTSYSLDSFAFLGRISSRPYGFVVRHDAAWKTFEEFRRAAARDPDRYTIGTTPQGGVFLTAQHLVRRGGLRLVPVPYGGSGPYLTAVLGGHVDAAWAPLTSADSYLRANQMRLLALTGPSRASAYPDAPTFAELGIDAPFVLWVGLVAPRGLPPERLSFLRESLARMLQDPAYLQAAGRFGVEPAYAPADAFERQVREEDQVFRALVRDLGLAPK